MIFPMLGTVLTARERYNGSNSSFFNGMNNLMVDTDFNKRRKRAKNNELDKCYEGNEKGLENENNRGVVSDDMIKELVF